MVMTIPSKRTTAHLEKANMPAIVVVVVVVVVVEEEEEEEIVDRHRIQATAQKIPREFDRAVAWVYLGIFPQTRVQVRVHAQTR